MNQNPSESTLVFRIKPTDFSPVVETSCCYFQVGDKFLFAKRSLGKPEGGKWGIPGGKIEKGESAQQAVVREMFEETGVHLDQEKLKYIGELFIRKIDVDYVFHIFHQVADHSPNVVLNNEHEEYCWSSLDEASKLPIMSGGKEVLQHFIALSNKPMLSRKPFFFLRHGQTDANANPNQKWVDFDLPLNSEGRNQAEIVGKQIVNLPIKNVYFSPLQRVVETKNIVVSDVKLDHFEMGELSECKAHVWTKMVQLELGTGYQVCDEVKSYFNNTLRGLSSALENESTSLIVAHGGTHWAFCYHLRIQNHPWKIGNCQLVHFQPVGDIGWEAKIIR